MIKAIKNTSKESIDLETITIEPSSTVTLKWDKEIITPQSFGLMIFHFSEGNLVALNGNGKEINKKRKAKFFKRNKSGKKNKNETTVNFDDSIIKLNELYNNLINTKEKL